MKQSTSVRWLSLINSLQSFHRAYKATKKVLHKHDKQVYVSPNDLKWINRLLLPFKVITEKVQTGNKPSLHMVLLSTFILRHTLSSTEELQRFFANFNNKEKENNDDVDGQVDSEDDELNIETEPTGKTSTLFTIYLTRFMKVLLFFVNVWNVYSKTCFNWINVIMQLYCFTRNTAKCSSMLFYEFTIIR